MVIYLSYSTELMNMDSPTASYRSVLLFLLPHDKLALFTSPTPTPTASKGVPAAAPAHSPVHCSVELGMFAPAFSVQARAISPIMTSLKGLLDSSNHCKGGNCNSVRHGSPLQVSIHYYTKRWNPFMKYWSCMSGFICSSHSFSTGGQLFSFKLCLTTNQL